MDKRRNQYPAGVKPHGTGIQVKFKESTGAPYTFETLPWSPTPSNLVRAGRLRSEILASVKYGAYDREKFFAHEKRGATSPPLSTFLQYAQTWLNSPENDWKPQTRYKFKGILNRVWIPRLHDKPMQHITYSLLMEALRESFSEFEQRNGKEPSQSIYNDWLTCVRGVFETAIKDGVLHHATNPAAELKNKTRTKVEPDPFDESEREAIIADIYRHNGPMWGAWFELAFFTGMRYPSEPSALKWSDIDLRKGEIRITKIRSKHAQGGIQDTTKTGRARTVHMNSRARGALDQVRVITGFQDDGPIFLQSNGPVTTGDPQRNIWRASLKRLKIRYRDPYNTRHSYASWALTKGNNPAFMANQLGHSLEEFFKTYAKWIGRSEIALQMELMEKGISGSVASERSLPHSKTVTC
ncbi:MAG: hypothetical protein A2286_06205 [Gammaproteobacteria bacterium RIFOXYA12_FULL_61_12]|nr:MAG: hypothetical protein A2286_06205 [Gammaproteobacteria bacterium RIFOXYA12_FULL_61_12]